AVTFDLRNQQQAIAVLNQFADWLQNMLSQFCLASSLAEHQPTLASGSWEVLRGSDLLAVVDLRLGAGVAPGVNGSDLAGASWRGTCPRSMWWGRSRRILAAPRAVEHAVPSRIPHRATRQACSCPSWIRAPSRRHCGSRVRWATARRRRRW